MSFYSEMDRKIERADRAYRDHVADCPDYIDGRGGCGECDRLIGVVNGLRDERNEGPDWKEGR